MCDSWAEAKQAEAELLQTLRNRAEQEAEASTEPATLGLLCQAYAFDLEARGISRDSIERAAETIRRMQEFFGPRMQEALSKIKPAELYAFRAWRIQNHIEPSTLNRDFRTIRAMFRRGLPGFAFPKGLFLPEDETRVKWLRPEEELVVFATMPVPFGDIARLASLTLMRLSEIRTLRKEQVDIAQGIVTLPQTKSTPWHVILSAEAREILAGALQRSAGPWVFPNANGRPYSRNRVATRWREAAKAAGLSDFHFHDLRHYGATMALNAGFTASIVMALGGWKTERMMRRYAAVTDKTLRIAAEVISGKPRKQAEQEINGNGPGQQSPKRLSILATV